MGVRLFAMVLPLEPDPTKYQQPTAYNNQLKCWLLGNNIDKDDMMMEMMMMPLQPMKRMQQSAG
jgi:hypothetical protein